MIGIINTITLLLMELVLINFVFYFIYSKKTCYSKHEKYNYMYRQVILFILPACKKYGLEMSISYSNVLLSGHHPSCIVLNMDRLF